MYSHRVVNTQFNKVNTMGIEIQNLYNVDNFNDHISLSNHNGKLVISDKNGNDSDINGIATEGDYNRLLNEVKEIKKDNEEMKREIEKLRDMILYMPPQGNSGYLETKKHFDNLVNEKDE